MTPEFFSPVRQFFFVCGLFVSLLLFAATRSHVHFVNALLIHRLEAKL